MFEIKRYGIVNRIFEYVFELVDKEAGDGMSFHGSFDHELSEEELIAEGEKVLEQTIYPSKKKEVELKPFPNKK